MKSRFAALVVLGLACSSGPPPDGATSITTDKGVVQGVVVDGVREWLGIPYAAPPTGANRFLPPKDVAAWSTPRSATAIGHSCAQLASGATPALSSGSDEDCLYLNVWAPEVEVNNAPVFVWIHGGGFTQGSGGEPLYRGAPVVVQSNAIVVTLNYRLGALGWLSHPELATEEGVTTSPSPGLLDQQAAMRWVQRNIAAFGGDPNNVTLAGESAGAISVCTHLVAPASKGLFSRAIMESGVCFSSALFTTPAVANDQGTRLATAVSCTTAPILDCLRAAPPEKILAALPPRLAEFGPTGDSFGPVVDGTVLPTVPETAIAAGNYVKVPLIIGSNINEGDIFVYLFGSPAPTPTDVRGSLGVLFDVSVVDKIAAQYAVDTDAPTAFSHIITDTLACDARRIARVMSAGGVPAFLYQFTYPYKVAALPGVTGSHSFELPFVFRNGYLGVALSDPELALADQVDGYWFRFAATGDPNGAPALAWPAYSQTNDTNIVLDATLSTNVGLKKDACDFWDALTP